MYSVKSLVVSEFLLLIWGHSIMFALIGVGGGVGGGGVGGSIKVQTSKMVHQSANR